MNGLGKGGASLPEHTSLFEPANIIRALDELLSQEQVSEDYVRFRKDLFAAQRSAYDTLAYSAPSGATNLEECSRSIEPSDVPFDRGLLSKLLEDLSTALKIADRPHEDLARLSTATADSPGLLLELASKAAFGPDHEFLAALSDDLKIHHEALLFFGRVLSAPFVTEGIRRLKQRSPEAPRTVGDCPWCGSPPGLAMLMRGEHGEGKRFLFCSLCAERWELDRLQCPFCASQEGRSVLSVEADDPCTVETCDRCKGYLKTIDERKTPDDHTVIPLVATTAGLHLDLIAEKEGYARGLPYAALR